MRTITLIPGDGIGPRGHGRRARPALNAPAEGACPREEAGAHTLRPWIRLVGNSRSGRYLAGAVQSPTRLPDNLMFIVSFVFVMVMRIWPS